MSITDEESKALADESRMRAGELSRLRDELQGLITADGRPAEREQLAAFDAAWKAFRDVDERLLPLAVANTNLKAARLAAGDSARTIDRVVDAIATVEAATSDPGLLRDLSAASVAALRIQDLLAPHIASADEAEMTTLEQRMRSHGDTIDRALAGARDHAPDSAQPQVSAATSAWNDYQRLLADVVRLSRANTNVVSVDVSLHEKRRVTAACRDALDALLAAVRADTNVPG